MTQQLAQLAVVPVGLFETWRKSLRDHGVNLPTLFLPVPSAIRSVECRWVAGADTLRLAAALRLIVHRARTDVVDRSDLLADLLEASHGSLFLGRCFFHVSSSR